MIAPALVEAGVDPNRRDENNETPLFAAVRRLDLRAIDSFYRAGANMSPINNKRATPLAIAALNGQAAVVSALLACGANANIMAGYRLSVDRNIEMWRKALLEVQPLRGNGNIRGLVETFRLLESHFQQHPTGEIQLVGYRLNQLKETTYCPFFSSKMLISFGFLAAGSVVTYFLAKNKV